MNDINAEFFVKTTTGLGGTFYKIAGQCREDWSNGIFQNAYGYAIFSLTENKNSWSLTNLVMDSVARKDGLKFRKINGKTRDDVDTKFKIWVDKNQKYMMLGKGTC